MKNKLILITVVRKSLKTFDMRDCLHSFIAPKCGRKKVVGSRGGEHVPQCPVAGDANGGPINDIMLRGCAVYTGWVKKVSC